MHGGLLWAAFEEWAAHHHSARRSIGLHRHAASEPHRLLLGPVPAAGRPARQRAWPTWPRLKHPAKSQTDTLTLVWMESTRATMVARSAAAALPPLTRRSAR